MKCEQMPGLAAVLWAMTVPMFSGCGPQQQQATPSEATVTSTPSAQPEQAPAVPDMSAALRGKQDTPGEQVAAAPAAEEGAPEEVQEERQVAVAGVGKKGSSYGGGIITEPVSQYFGARERITFMNVQKAMRTFQAMHDRLPSSHEEFMEEIISANGIELPGLFDDERYEYDPEAGELMVVRPKKD